MDQTSTDVRREMQVSAAFLEELITGQFGSRRAFARAVTAELTKPKYRKGGIDVGLSHTALNRLCSGATRNINPVRGRAIEEVLNRRGQLFVLRDSCTPAECSAPPDPPQTTKGPAPL